MKSDLTGTVFVVSGALFLAGLALVAFQIFSSTADADDSFSRVFAAGAGGLFTSAALLRLLERSQWSPWQKTLAVSLNFIAVTFACWLILSAVWPSWTPIAKPVKSSVQVSAMGSVDVSGEPVGVGHGEGAEGGFPALAVLLSADSWRQFFAIYGFGMLFFGAFVSLNSFAIAGSSMVLVSVWLAAPQRNGRFVCEA